MVVNDYGAKGILLNQCVYVLIFALMFVYEKNLIQKKPSESEVLWSISLHNNIYIDLF